MYDSKHKQFCNSKCATSYNNKIRVCKKDRVFSGDAIRNIQKANVIRGQESETSCKNTENLARIEGLDLNCLLKGNRIYFQTKIEFVNCKNCSKLFVKKKNRLNLCCSKECSTNCSIGYRTYQNGKRKNIYYFNRWQNKDVLLESTWEKDIAELLDSVNIKWERPKFIKWTDSENKKRLYYPDFFLNDYDLYLDPKNPFAMVQDKEKIDVVSKQINIVFGHLNLIKETIRNLK